MDLLEKLCKISMCDPDDSLDVDYVIDNSCLGGTGSEHFVIEFVNKNPVFTVTVGQKIHEDDIIGYIENYPVKSQVSGIITQVTSRYIIGDYLSSIDEMLDSLLENGEISTDKILAKFGLSQSDIKAENGQNIDNSTSTQQQMNLNGTTGIAAVEAVYKDTPKTSLLKTNSSLYE